MLLLPSLRGEHMAARDAGGNLARMKYLISDKQKGRERAVPAPS
jgi:hypothetical protein